MEVKLKKVRLSFPNLWHAKEFKTGDGKPRFDATFLIEPGSDNDKAILKAIDEAGRETFAEKWPTVKKAVWGQTNKCAYLDGEVKAYAGYEGVWTLSCHAKARPLVIDRNRDPLTEQDGKPYAGCYVNAKVEIYVQKGENTGIRASFSGIQFDSDGDAFTGGKTASPDDFDDLGVDPDAEDLF